MSSSLSVRNAVPKCLEWCGRASLPAHTQAVLADIQTLQPDSILLFGKPQDATYELLLTVIRKEGPYSTSKPLVDPEVGEIGRLLSKQ